MKKKQDALKQVDLLNITGGKVPPHNLEAEKAVLGAIMLESEAFDVALETLKPECFYLESHQLTFHAMIRLSAGSKPIDILTVEEELKKSGDIDKVGGAYFLTRLTNEVVSSAHIDYHSKIIYEKYLKRQLFRNCMETALKAYSDEEDGFDLIDTHNSTINQLSLLQGVDIEDLPTLLMSELKRLMELRTREDYITGVPTGFKTLDKTTGGWQDTDLIIIAARPSVGKTAFALNVARGAAQSKVKPTPVGFLSLEMSAGQLTRRLMSAESGIDLDLLNNPKKLTDQQMEFLYVNGVQKLSTTNIHIDATAALTVFEAKAKARKLKKKYGIGLLIVDYLQLMTGDRKSTNREQEISTISRGLKALAKELKIPIIALSQLNREVEKDKREPRLSDLRESGAIEQDADMVVFLTRQDYQSYSDHGGEGDVSNMADMHIKKHRNGPLEKLAFYTVLNIQRWMTPMEYEQYQRNLSYSNMKPLSSASNYYEPEKDPF